MDEWGVVTVIIALAGFVVLFLRPAWSMAKSSQKLADSVEALKASFEKREEEDKQLRKMVYDHETRIKILEHNEERDTL